MLADRLREGIRALTAEGSIEYNANADLGRRGESAEIGRGCDESYAIMTGFVSAVLYLTA